jgi:hypothetical protein
MLGWVSGVKPVGANLTSVRDEKRVGGEEDDRADRNRERSQEAHWQVAEAGAKEADDPRRQTPKEQETAVPNGDFPNDDDKTNKAE